MVNNLCFRCSGRGFMWIRSKWQSQPNRVTYAQGPMCKRCKGSGKEPNFFSVPCLVMAGVITGLAGWALYWLTT